MSLGDAKDGGVDLSMILICDFCKNEKEKMEIGFWSSAGGVNRDAEDICRDCCEQLRHLFNLPQGDRNRILGQIDRLKK